MKRFILLSIVLAGGFWFYQGRFVGEEKIDLPEAKEYQDFVEDDIVNEDDIDIDDLDIVTSSEDEDVIIELAKKEEIEDEVLGEKIVNTSINLAVPFTSQAPTANWDQPWQDACEEASVLMVDYYYQDTEMPRAREVQQTLFDMVVWQEENWQGHFNLPIEKLAEYVEKNYDYDYEILDDLTVDKIKDYLDRGLPVIVPANGKKLEQPYFSDGGPEYHMLVIRGYMDDSKKFISNDPGTWRGDSFLYSYDNMMESIADWDKKRSSATGPKRALILYKN